ncbi:sensor histidine kinase [Croceicoccus gelatinilyticus]|uniref:sensor histidine kinase n=1 Tax=Croceicoccus gelatinilyticus TaxID=2835536 RepID=UPI001BCB83E4|nr:CHASE3 domain-containing protein [Croceicoccus gelatinilyticus]MBS7669720.1 CHASE3 domain-containing protein [Croceicoccus gelatinilyticus]
MLRSDETGGTRQRRAPILLVLTLTAIGLIGSLLLVWSTIASERAEREQVERTNEIMVALRDIDRAAINAEAGQRGYFITLDKRYLASYEFGRALYPRSMDNLKTEVEAAGMLPRQEELLSTIEQHADTKFDQLAKTVAMIDRGEIRDAQQRILSDEGRIAMERLRNSLSEMEALEQGILASATQEAAAAEDRVLPLLSVTLLLTLGSLGLGLWSTVRATHAEAQAAQAAQLAEARDRADLLAHELNHRVKNLFAVILAIVRMSARDKPEAKPVVDSISARIHALLDAHEATQGKDTDGTARMRVLVDKVLAPYSDEGNQFEVSGPDVELTPREATPLGLVLHELTTNAVKYGAWSNVGGKIAINWTYEGSGDDRALQIRWQETSPSPKAPTERQGFGSMLMQSSARQLSGTIDREFNDQGMVVDIRFPHTTATTTV